MTNHLVGSNSPYLLQHVNNPVDWYPWGEAALKKAQDEEKPIFLSIGYAACHWCHVMAHESFEDPEIAEIMNRYFVNIKVDREERPDLDGIYMNAVVAMTGHGGWPMSVFLTPVGHPFYGGTYFPPIARYNMPAFREVLLSVAKVWSEDRERILKSGDRITRHIQASTRMVGYGEDSLGKDTQDQAELILDQSYDWRYGGWGKAPKFPQPMAIEFLLRRAVQGNQRALEIATHALRVMARGGMYDVIGGGFSRYSTDDRWLVPHFEKMLYDNAQLATAYLHAYLLTGDIWYRRICESTLEFIMREMTDPSGAFFSSLDADSEGEEGKYYLWTLEEVQQVLDDQDDIDFFVSAYGMTAQGNFEGKTVLQRAKDDPYLAGEFKIDSSEVTPRLNDLHGRLLNIREKRVRPGTDDKALISWNALMLFAFSEAAKYLGRDDFKLMAMRNAKFSTQEFINTGQLFRSWRKGKWDHQAYLEDYASLIIALISLYQTDPDPTWFEIALKLAKEMVAHFTDVSGGFYDTRDDHENLIIRPKDIQDNAMPSGNSLAATALLYLSAYEGVREWRDIAERMLIQVQEFMKRYPLAFSQWLCAIDFAISPQIEVAILGSTDLVETQSLNRAIWSRYRPNIVVASTPFPPPENAPKLLENRRLLKDLPTAYVCRSFVCNQPVNTPAELLLQLDNVENDQW
jgi:hypothetical protein